MVQGIRVAKWCGIGLDPDDKDFKKSAEACAVPRFFYLEIFHQKWCLVLLGRALKMVYITLTGVGLETARESHCYHVPLIGSRR